VLAEVEVRLRLDADLVSPCIVHISKVPPHAIVSVVDGTAGYRHLRVELALRIGEREEPLHVVHVERLYSAAMELDVLL
jgi:hypothetical protein